MEKISLALFRERNISFSKWIVFIIAANVVFDVLLIVIDGHEKFIQTNFKQTMQLKAKYKYVLAYKFYL